MVACPRQIGSRPLASGSRLPVWPALRARNALRTRCRAAFELIPSGLSSRTMPSTSCCWTSGVVSRRDPFIPRPVRVRHGAGGRCRRHRRSGPTRRAPRSTESSMRNWISGATRSRIWLRTWWRRNPAACWSASSAALRVARARKRREINVRVRQVARNLRRGDRDEPDPRDLSPLGARARRAAASAALRLDGPSGTRAASGLAQVPSCRATSTRSKHSIWSFTLMSL